MTTPPTEAPEKPQEAPGTPPPAPVAQQTPKASWAAQIRLRERWRGLPHIGKIGIIVGTAFAAIFGTLLLWPPADPYADVLAEATASAVAAPTPEPTPTPTPTPLPTPTPKPLGVVPLRQHHYQDYRFYHFLYEYERCQAYVGYGEYLIWKANYEDQQAQGGPADGETEILEPPEVYDPAQDPFVADAYLERYALRNMPHTVSSLMQNYRNDVCPEIREYHLLNGRTKWILEWLEPTPTPVLP